MKSCFSCNGEEFVKQKKKLTELFECKKCGSLYKVRLLRKEVLSIIAMLKSGGQIAVAMLPKEAYGGVCLFPADRIELIS